MDGLLAALLGKKQTEANRPGVGRKPLSDRERARATGQRGKRFAPAQSPSTAVAGSYMLGGLGGTPKQRLDFFGQMGRKETLRKGLARLSPAMSRRARRRSVEHMKMLAVAEEFARGEERTGRTR
jgi:hypothetical protein